MDTTTARTRRNSLAAVCLLLSAAGPLTACGSTSAAATGSAAGGPAPAASAPAVPGPSASGATATAPLPPRVHADTLGVPYGAAPSVSTATAATTATTATATATAEPCPASGVVLRAGEPDAAMGLRAMTVELTNCGTRPYALNGYPTVRVLDDRREPFDIAVSHGASAIAVIDRFDAGPTPLTLKPGERAVFGLTWRNTVTDVNSAPVNGSYLEITPRPGDRAQSIAILIDLGTTGKLGISAWSSPR
ncbi:DUF4232 domain-containing protein [Kitasatospora sp. NPDC056138]|uniref:DUF4232 domain-containing protein n=1 Tax=Kitasatospora sp. NPDC056138 TaxID=3345724 RepID=UPI0035DFF553